MSSTSRVSFVVVCLTLMTTIASAENWPQFRGPGGRGVSNDTIPSTWSDSENLSWKTPLPGKGSSSPIVFGDRVFVTCFSGDDRALTRHLVCVNRADGKIAWSKKVNSEQSEDSYRGYITEHGYASNTPVTDGKQVFVFFGKTGVLAYDMEGKKLWQANTGTESSNRRWGSGASPILYKDTVIVNASDESQSIRALDKKTGKEVWKSEASSLELAYGTPSIVTSKDQSELVIGVAGEVWGLNPDTGKLRWYAETSLTGNVCPSPVVDKDLVYVFGGYRSSGSQAIRLGGKGDVTESHTTWTTRNSSYVATPLLHEGHLYWVDDRGQAFCTNAKSGELVYRERLRDVSSGGRPFYASPVLAKDKIVVVSRWDGAFLFAAKPEFKQIARNVFESDDSDFSGTPAICDGQVFLRSGKALYCVGKK